MKLKHLVIVIVLALGIASCAKKGEYRKLEGGVWATTYHITYNSPVDLSDSVIAVFKQVEMSLSPFADSSLISRINRGEDVMPDSLLRRIFTASQQVCEVSGGAFDPSVSPLVNLWGFGYKKTGIEPTQAAIDSLLPLVGIRDCALAANGKLVKKHLATEFNFSAITKGYGCDLVGEMLRRNGCTDYMVEIGGEIALSGVNDRGEPWRIMVDAPVENDTAVVHNRMAVIAPGNGGVATSGNYRNFRTTADGKVWHTISPVTGRPAVTDLLSATVVAPSAMLADAYATACMAKNAHEAEKMLENVKGVEALLVTADTVIATKGFPERKK